MLTHSGLNSVSDLGQLYLIVVDVVDSNHTLRYIYTHVFYTLQSLTYKRLTFTTLVDRYANFIPDFVISYVTYDENDEPTV